MIRIFAHLARHAARTSAAVALLAAARPAHAQPACADGTMADYAADGFSCRIGPWRLDSFYFDAGASANPGNSAYSAGEADILVHPFTAVDAAGRRTFGLAFDNFTSSVGVTGSPAGLSSTHAGTVMGFAVTAVRPDLLLLGARYALSASITGDAGAARYLTGRGMGSVGALPTDCGFPIARQGGGTGSVALHDEVPCAPAPIDRVSATLASDAFLDRVAPDAVTFDGPATATGTVERVTFVVAPDQATVTPEPASALLMGAGLAAIGVVARRRRGGRSR
jgi:hypothetical protein